jgi:hypothetical protein
MQITYRLNPTNAKQVGQPGRIDERGAYTGIFTRAEHIVSQKGTNGIEFSFKSDDGRTSDYLTIWIASAGGEELYGKKILDALMTCLRTKSLTSIDGTVRKYDRAAGGEVTATATIFPDLMNKPIGVLLVREEYAKSDGTSGWKMSIAGCYEAATEKTPREVLDNLPAGSLEKIVATLRDRPLKNKPVAQSTRTDVADFDDDVPF